MKPEKIAHFRRVLQEQRRALFDEVSSVESDLEELAQDREPEIEETAQGERNARILARLDARGKAELEAIDAALARTEAGDYGVCSDCGGSVPMRRLHALPATPYCRDCAEESERRGASLEHEPGEPVRPAPVPADYSLLSGRELEEAIRDHLHEDGRVDMEELRIVCRHGVVHLSGSVPSEGEHQIVRQTVTDVMGLKEIDDHLQVEELLWEREDRDKNETAAEPRPWEELGGTEDVTETHEDGVDFVAPVRPVPEEE